MALTAAPCKIDVKTVISTALVRIFIVYIATDSTFFAEVGF